MNGLQLHHEAERFSATAFASRDNSRRVVEELRGNGTSGPYGLSNGLVVKQSEQVEIIVRDRNQPSVVLRVVPQTRFSDYQIDGLTEGILFRRPIPSLDEDLNPIFIRVSYEVEQGGPKFTVSGVSGQFKLTNNLQLGGSWIKDANPLDGSDLRGLNAIFRLSPNTVLFGEWAHSETPGNKGSAHQLTLEHNSARLQARLFAGSSEAGFDNPNRC